MAIRGSLREASVADVLQLLALGRKTGCLSVSDRQSFGRIYLESGKISHASIVNRRDRLGDLLVKNGLVAPDELDAAVAAQTGQDSQRLGEILVRRGSISREQLEHYVAIQIREAVYHLFTWTRGVFHFETDARQDPQEMVLAIDSESLLLEGARRVDELAVIEKRIPSHQLVFALDRSHGDPEAAELTPEQRRIVPLVDGHRSVGEIVEESGLLDFDAVKALYGLIQAGFARPRGRRGLAVDAGKDSTRIGEHLNLGNAFYRTLMLDEAEREFRHVLGLEPDRPDALLHMGLIAFRRGDDRAAIGWMMRLIEQGRARAAAYHQLALALERLGRHQDALTTTEVALRTHPDHDGLLLSRAILLVKTHRPLDAVPAFELHDRNRPPGPPPLAAYFVFAPLALAAAGRLEEAREIAEAGSELYPRVAPLFLHLGAVLERSGEPERARAAYLRAKQEDGDLPQADRAIERLDRAEPIPVILREP